MISLNYFYQYCDYRQTDYVANMVAMSLSVNSKATCPEYRLFHMIKITALSDIGTNWNSA
jgi:hypothetical protein